MWESYGRLISLIKSNFKIKLPTFFMLCLPRCWSVLLDLQPWSFNCLILPIWLLHKKAMYVMVFLKWFGSLFLYWTLVTEFYRSRLKLTIWNNYCIVMCNTSNYNNVNPSRMFMFGIFGRLGYSYFKICQIHYSFHSLPFLVLFSFKSHCRNPFLGPSSRSHHDHKIFHHVQDLNCGISLSAYHFLPF